MARGVIAPIGSFDISRRICSNCWRAPATADAGVHRAGNSARRTEPRASEAVKQSESAGETACVTQNRCFVFKGEADGFVCLARLRAFFSQLFSKRTLFTGESNVRLAYARGSVVSFWRAIEKVAPGLLRQLHLPPGIQKSNLMHKIAGSQAGAIALPERDECPYIGGQTTARLRVLPERLAQHGIPRLFGCLRSARANRSADDQSRQGCHVAPLPVANFSPSSRHPVHFENLPPISVRNRRHHFPSVAHPSRHFNQAFIGAYERFRLRRVGHE